MTELKEKPTYNELRSWFIENMDEFPEKLDSLKSEGVYYNDVKFTAKLHIDIVDSEIQKHGSDIKRSKIAIASNNRLIAIYESLKKKENWNQPLPDWNMYHNKMN